MPAKKPGPHYDDPRTKRLRDLIEQRIESESYASQKEIAQAAKITVQTLSNIANGHKEFKDSKSISGLARALDVNPGYFRLETNDPTPLHAKSPIDQIRERDFSRDPERDVAVDIKAALEVLGSNTHYAASLHKNIHSFLDALEEKRRNHFEIEQLREHNKDLENRVFQLENELREFRSTNFPSPLGSDGGLTSRGVKTAKSKAKK